MNTIQKSKPETFCAWCHPGEPSPNGSHGICKAHADEIRAQFNLPKEAR